MLTSRKKLADRRIRRAGASRRRWRTTSTCATIPATTTAPAPAGDQVAYIELAQQILHGTWQGAVHYMPGLPAVIAVGQLLTGDPRLGIAVLQGLVYALVVVLAARLARASFRRRRGRLGRGLRRLEPGAGLLRGAGADRIFDWRRAAGAGGCCISPGRVGRVWAWSRWPGCSSPRPGICAPSTSAWRCCSR